MTGADLLQRNKSAPFLYDKNKEKQTLILIQNVVLCEKYNKICGFMLPLQSKQRIIPSLTLVGKKSGVIP